MKRYKYYKGCPFRIRKKYPNSSNIEELFELDGQYYNYLEEEIKKNPKNIQALIHLGALSWEPFHEDEKAIEYLEKAIKYDPKNVDARFWLAACYYHDRCEYDIAKKILLEALQIDPKRADCLSLLATVVEDIDDAWNEAIGYMEKAVMYEPNWPMLRLFLGSLYVKTKNIPLAAAQEKKIQELAQLPLSTPKNGIEYYYDLIITGKCNRNIPAHLTDLKERIQKEKMKT